MEADQVVQDPLVQDIDPRQPSFALSTGRECSWCRGALEVTARIDARFCSQRCRQAAHRFGRHCEALERAAEPMRLAYADPPYPGLARRYYEGHPDYAGEVDHEALLSRLQEFDGWALSTSADALPEVLAIVAAMGLEGVRVAAWVRGARPTPSRSPLTSWEPVLYGGGRRELSDRPALDSLSHVSRPRTTDPDRVVGAKPADFAWWLFSLLGARPGDDFHDLFPGSGGMSRAWAALEARAVLPAVSAEPSRSPADDASCSADGHASHLEDVDASPVDTLTRDWIGELRDRYAAHPSRVDDCDGCQTFGICAKHLSAAEALARGEAPCPNCGAEAGEPCKGRCASPPRSKESRATSKRKPPAPPPPALYAPPKPKAEQALDEGDRWPARLAPSLLKGAKIDPYGIACPLCDAAAGEPCRPPSKDPSRRDWTHAKRQLVQIDAEEAARETADEGQARVRSRRKKAPPAKGGLGKRRPKNARGIQRGSPSPPAGSPAVVDDDQDTEEWCRWCEQSMDPDHFCPGDVDEFVCDPDHAEAYVWCPSCGAEPREPCIPIDGDSLDIAVEQAPELVHSSRGAALLVARYGHNRLDTRRAWERLTLSPCREVWCPRQLLERWADDLPSPGDRQSSAVQPSGEADQGDHEGGARP